MPRSGTPPYHIRETHWPELGFAKVEGRGGPWWRIIDMNTGDAIGPIYRSRSELLADLTRFAQEFGVGQGAGLSGLGASRAPADEHAANELVLYADNDERLYTTSYQPIVRNLLRHMRRGVYDPERAVDGFMHHADRAAQSYAREGGASGRNWHQIFSVPTRRLAAEHWARSFESAYASGEMAHFMERGR